MREYEHVFDQGVVVNYVMTHRFQLLDDGKERIDALWLICSILLAGRVLGQPGCDSPFAPACAQIPCQHQIPAFGIET